MILARKDSTKDTMRMESPTSKDAFRDVMSSMRAAQNVQATARHALHAKTD